MQNILAFEIETIADIEGGRKLYGLDGLDGSQVRGAFQDGRLEEVRDYCEADSLNTYLLYLRWEFMRGNLTRDQFTTECGMVRSELEKQDKEHFNRFLGAWGQGTF